MPDPSPERPDTSDYLGSSDIIDYDNPLVQHTAEQLTNDLNDSLSKARIIYQFTRDHIFNSFKINATSVTKKASEVLDQGHGTCFAKAHVLVALMRASGIPAGFCYQIRYDNNLERLIAHGFNGVFIAELEKRVRLYACIPFNIDNQGFDSFKEQSFQNINEDLEESDDYIIYSSPIKKILKILSGSNTLEELKSFIPAKI